MIPFKTSLQTALYSGFVAVALVSQGCSSSKVPANASPTAPVYSGNVVPTGDGIHPITNAPGADYPNSNRHEVFAA